jgi:nicotinate-nucleotide--dimethylbenzimidazole phosphoribosyltransferase
MTKEEALEAIAAGLEMADAISGEGFSIMGVGEMGIGNTTTSAAVLSAITGKPAEYTVGRGGGVNDAGFARKKEIVDQVSAKYRTAGGVLNAPEDVRTDQMIEVLAGMSGFDICAMTGAFLGAAANRMPVVIDGYISAVAALAAFALAPAAADYMIASHKSFEKGYTLAIETLGLKPFLSLDMRLGEGSGCPIAFSIIRGACDVMADMATFDEAEINDEYLEEIRQEEKYQK